MAYGTVSDTVTLRSCRRSRVLTVIMNTSGSSFEPFKSQNRDSNNESFCNDFVQAGRDLLDVTFESDVFEFSVTESTTQDGLTELPRSSSWFPDFSSLTEPTSVDVAIHEQLAATYDDFSQDGAISVKGSIYIRTAATNVDILIEDDARNISRVEPDDSICKLKQHKNSGRSLHIQLEPNQSKEELFVATYYCGANLRPVPLLVKSRVSALKGFARVGFKIRANPNNERSLSNAVIIIAVPPDVDGGHCKMSRRGGNWDDLKRTLTWRIPTLAAGEALEIQAQFPFIEDDNRSPKFPVLVQCDYPHIFSNVSIVTKNDALRIKSSMTGLIIHRKV